MPGFQKIGSFSANDAAGKIYRVDRYRMVTHADNSRVTSGVAPIVTEDMQLEDGRGVNKIEKGRYRVRDTDIELTSNDPAAP